MEQVGYQGYAQTTGFNPVKVSQANVEAIARDGARTIKGMQEFASQDIKNRQAQLNAITNNAQLEAQNRQQNFDAETVDRQRYQEAVARNFRTEIKSFETRGANAGAIFKDLSALSTTAGKISEQVVNDIVKERETAEMWSNVIFGVDSKELMASLKAEHAVYIGGEAIETKADQLEAMGGDPVAVNAMRAQNPANIIRNKKGRVFAAIKNLPEYVRAAFEDEKLVVNIKLPDGSTKSIKATEAQGSAERAAVFPEIYKRFLVENGLHTLKATMLAPLHEVAYNQFTSDISETRKLEVQEAQAKRVEDARDYLTDSGSVEAFQNFSRVLKRQLGYVEGRKELFKHIFTATDGKGGMLYSDVQLDEFLAQSFEDQENKPIGDRYSAEVAEYRSLRRKAQTSYINDISAAENAQNDQWTSDVEEWIRSNNPSQQDLENLIDTAKRSGNFNGAKVIAGYMEFTPEGQQEKMFNDLFAEYESLGTLTQEEVRKAPISSKLKTEWLKKAKESEAMSMPKETADDIERVLNGKLRSRIGDYKGETKNPTLTLALRAAKAQAQRDYRLALMKPGATQEDAFNYAIQRFEHEFDKKEGKYRIKDVTSKGVYSPEFSQFTIKGTTQMQYPLNTVMAKVKAHPDALDTQELISRPELEKIAKQQKAGKALSIPPTAQAIANMYGGNINAIEVVNRQLKRAGLDQVPIESYQQKVARLDPVYQRLLTYRPNTTRATIAGIGSGIGFGATPRANGAVNGPNEILSTFLAAGGSPKEAALMTAIAMAESRGKQDAHNTNAQTGDNSYGWWQINMIGDMGPARRQQFGLRSNEQLFDPMTNARAAIQVLRSQGLGAWGAYRNGSYKQFLTQAERAMASYGDGVWRQGMNMRTRVIEYITGDRSHPRYRSDHGGGNYHEHIAYATPAEALIAARKLEAAGIKVTQLKGHSPVGSHSENSYHYSGNAFDVPADQVPVGQEVALSQRVRAILGIN